MKALVLAGGSGSRLRPLTHTSAKQLIPVGNKPILFYGLEAIAKAGVSEVGIVVGDTAREVERAIGDGSAFGLQVTYLPQMAPLGLAHAVLIARSYLGDDNFVMYLGDNFLVGGICGIVEQFNQDYCDAHLLLTRVARPEMFGVADLDACGRITRVREKPDNPTSNLAVTGIYFFTPAVHEFVAGLEPSIRGELEITDAIQRMIDDDRVVECSIVSGYWKDTGSVEDILEVNRLVLESIEPRNEGVIEESQLIGRVIVEKGAVIRRCQILGPVVIATGSVITDSYVGPFTSIGEACNISDSEIEFSIVLRGSRISGIRRIECSLIGRDAEIAPNVGSRRSHQLVIGDHSKVRIRL